MRSHEKSLVTIISLGFDLTASGWGWRVGVLDEIKDISAQLGLGFGLSLATNKQTDSRQYRL